MFKRSIILFLLVYLNCIGHYGLAQYKVSGTVADSLTNDRLALVTVRLLDKNRVLLQSSISDSNGHFYFKNLASGAYQLYFGIIGYSPGASPIFTVKDTNVVFPVFLMARSSHSLAEVTITGERPLLSTEIDGFVYHAEQDIQSAGETAADLLGKIPGIRVDENGMPEIRGSNRIKVFIDGKPSIAFANSVAEALRQIPADNIKTVKVITHPSARYDAEGVDGVINILTKKPVDDGASGTVDGTLASRFNELTGAATWKKQRLIIGADAGHSRSENTTMSTLERIDRIAGNGGLLQRKQINNESGGIFGGVSFIYFPDSLTTLNTGYRHGDDRFETGSTLDNFAGSDLFSRNVNSPVFRYLHAVNAEWLHKSRDSLTEYNVMGYWFYQGQRSSYLLDQYREKLNDYSEKNRSSFYNTEFSFQADINKKFRQRSELEAGVKGAFREFSYGNFFEVFDFSRSVYLPDMKRADRFWFDWAVVAAYGSYTLNLKSWKIKGGLRYEHTHWPIHFRDTSVNTSDYQNILPNLILSKAISPNQSISAGYARKLLRPNISYLNPLINYLDSLNLEYGNPDLEPEMTNSFDLSYTFQKSSFLLNIALFYNQTGNSIQRVRIEQAGGIVVNTYANIASYDVFGASVNASLRLNRFTFSLTNTTRFLEFKVKNDDLRKTGFKINQSIDVSFRPGGSLTIRGYANLNSGNINIQGYTTGVQSYTFSVDKGFFKDKLNISARCDNLFASYRYVTEVTHAETFNQRIESRYPNRVFRLAVRWKLGKKEIRKPQLREIGGY